MDIKFDGKIPDRHKEMEKPECMSIKDQLAALNDNIEEPKKDEEPIISTVTNRMKTKGNQNVFKEPKKKMKKSTKVIIGVVVANLALLSLIIFLINGQINKKPSESKKNENISNVSKEEKEELGNGTTLGTLQSPSGIKDVDDAINAFNTNNEIVVTYLQNMKSDVIDYINRDRNDIYIEDIMKDYEEKILNDLDTLGQYKKYYEQFDADDLYVVTVNRYQNAYSFAQTCKNVMTEKALKNNANHYIEKEEELNVRNTNAFASFLDANDIEFTLKDNEIEIE